MTFAIVLFGWIFSLCLHEFSHALVAYYGGDYTVREKGYLTFNPLKYTHPSTRISFAGRHRLTRRRRIYRKMAPPQSLVAERHVAGRTSIEPAGRYSPCHYP